MKNVAGLLLFLLTISTVSIAQDFRTFSAADLSEKKAVPRKPVATECQFTFVNDQGSGINGIHLEFNASVEVEFSNSFTYGELLNANGRIWKISGAEIDNMNEVSVTVSTAKKSAKVTRWWWLNGNERVGTKRSKNEAVSTYGRLSMPNEANVRDEVFVKRSSTITLGIPMPQQKNEYGWVILKKSADMQKSLLDRDDYHFGQPRGFSRLANGTLFKGEVKVLTPSKMNNRLFANLAALKFNIIASEEGITPVGLGELYCNDEASPFHGWQVKQIALHADSMMTFWRGKMKVDYEQLDDCISRINEAFRGPIDTISFSSKLLLTGVASANGFTFLTSTTTIAVGTEKSRDEVSSIIPDVSELKQNYPNPFNPTTVIGYSLSVNSLVTLKVYNMLGQEVSTLISNELVDAGTQEVAFSGDNLSSGTYIYRLTAENKEEDYSFEKTMRMTLVK